MRLCICDDHQLFSEALTALLESEGHHVAARLDDPAAVVDVVRSEPVDICVMDLNFADSPVDPLDVIARLSELVTVVVLTGDDDISESRILAAGAAACARKVQRGQALVALLEQVHAGGAAGEYGEQRWARPEPFRFLTDREFDVLGGLVEGASTADLARRLTVRPATVRAHLQSLFVKLGVHSRLEAVARAVELGFLTSPRGDDAPAYPVLSGARNVAVAPRVANRYAVAVR